MFRRAAEKNGSLARSPLVQGGLDSAKFDTQDEPYLYTSAANVPAEEPYNLKLQWQEDSNAPIPQIALRSIRFLIVVAVGIAIVAMLISFILHGITIEHRVGDPIGTSSEADGRVALFQTINGFFWAAFGLVLEQYYNNFLAVMVTFLSNSRWYPSDTPREGNSKLKRNIIFWFPPLMMYLINIALSSVFIEHKVSGQLRGLAEADLVATATFAVTSFSSKTGISDGANSVLDTVLRPAVLQKVTPFEISVTSPCRVDNLSKLSNGNHSASNTTGGNIATFIPNVVDIQSTSVSFAFPNKDWLLDAMPVALEPASSVKFDFKTFNDKKDESEKQYAAFLQENGLKSREIFDIIMQGFIQYDKTKTDSNTNHDYPCSDVDNDTSLDTTTMDSGAASGSTSTSTSSSASGSSTEGRRLSPDELMSPRGLQEEDDGSLLMDEGSGDEGSEEMEEYDEEDDDEVIATGLAAWQYYGNEDKDNNGKRKCFGMGSSLPMLSELNRETLEGVFGATSTTDDVLDITNVSIKFESYVLSPQVNVTAVTIDLPFKDFQEYRLGSRRAEFNCDGQGHFNDIKLAHETYPDPEDYALWEKLYCDPTFYPFETTSQCGARNCVFRDESEVVGIKKQLTMAPFSTHCDPSNVTYDHDLYSWFPGNCTEQSDSVFLFGLGSYLAGNFEEESVLITRARRHYVLSFAKLTWRFEDLSARFDAKCSEPGKCDGLLHKLEKVSDTAPKAKNKAQVLMVGKEHLYTPHGNYTMRSPLTLVSLNTPKFYYVTEGTATEDTYDYYTWENVNFDYLNTTYKESDGLGLENGMCSLLIDSYLEQVNENHYYINEPLQVMYTSAIYYLFQDAAVKDVTLPKKNKLGVVDLSQMYIGSARMKGDREKKEIKYSIPLVSAVSTSIGIAILLIYTAIVLKLPRDRVKLTDELNFAPRYADVLIDDHYPKNVHERRLRLPGGEKVEMDDYTVDSIKFLNIFEPDLKLTL
ncbi:hypothetical protein Poli38472_012407 [Pythium oligandrum]|uniref:Uncharacterized protein n=1 Tax=Pythium oligandrum TaxID=41045 RepID=A0A8K1FLM2_PYTOL|nr:hypothetical protein Poli38472_012407 [Pythium oligandrum]|eukprot:TMW67291.1 hypothetical protein Poli38472_012407 [Pythium oligandrum]